ncbi:MAG: T9SS type A sorting domain-containing protein, partial [Bacteroidota bacterium]
TVLNYYKNVNPAVVPMTFLCNLYFEVHSGHFNPAVDYLDVAGNFNNGGGHDLLFIKTSDSLYGLTLFFDTAMVGKAPLRFKFRKNGNWATSELLNDSNRSYTLHAGKNTFHCYYNNIDPSIPSLPIATNVMIQDSIVSKHVVTGAYSYEDYNLKREGISRYQWYTATAPLGTLTPIDSAWSINYTIDSLLIGKYLVFEVTPVTFDLIDGLPVQAWSPNKIVGVGFEELIMPEARCYPNPVEGLLHVEIIQTGKRLEMLNIYGQLLFTRNINRYETFTVDMGNLPAGVYILKLIGDGNAVKNYKIIHQ